MKIGEIFSFAVLSEPIIARPMKMKNQEMEIDWKKRF